MKLTIGKKLLLLLHWLYSLLICVAFALCVIVPSFQADLISRVEGTLGNLGARIAGGALLAPYLALSIATFLTLVRRKRRVERGFITVGPENHGQVRVSVAAVEQMVRQSVRSIDGITDMKVDIEGLDDSIAIAITASIANGVHVPTITANMQRAVAQFVEVSCGVAVQSVSVTINGVSGVKGETPRRRLLGRSKSQADAPETTFVTETPSAEPVGTAPASTAQSPVIEMGGEGWTGSAGAPEAAGAPKAASYDPDKPYESEFAKDFAAMKAREAEGEAASPNSAFPED